jgi:MiaB/RimO family radical SAM methylthiotransferase
MSAMKSVCISFVSGCPRSKVDTALLLEYFRANGWHITSRIGEADLLLIGGCGFSSFAEEKTLKFVSIASRRAHKNARIAVYGCLPGIDEDRLLKEFDVIPIKRSHFGKLDDLIGADIGIEDIKEVNTVEDSVRAASRSFSRFDRLRINMDLSRSYFCKAFMRMCVGRGPRTLESLQDGVFSIRTSRGCMEDCTYCAIKFAAGGLVSKPLNKILQEFRSGLSEGFKVFRLSAEDVGAYGQDIGSNIAELLDGILSHDGNYQLIWSDFHPRWLLKYSDSLLDLFARHSDRIGHAGFPIQSGSQKILERMNRSYDAGHALDCMSAIRKSCPHLQMATHIMVGFPGETEEDFQETRRFVRSVGFDAVEIYEYSDRPGVAASLLPEKLPQSVRFKRMWQFGREFPGISIIR